MYLRSMLSIKFNFDHGIASGMAHTLSGENVSPLVGFVLFLLKCPICRVVVILACLSVMQLFVQVWS